MSAPASTPGSRQANAFWPDVHGGGRSVRGEERGAARGRPPGSSRPQSRGPGRRREREARRRRRRSCPAARRRRRSSALPSGVRPRTWTSWRRRVEGDPLDGAGHRDRPLEDGQLVSCSTGRGSDRERRCRRPRRASGRPRCPRPGPAPSPARRAATAPTTDPRRRLEEGDPGRVRDGDARPSAAIEKPGQRAVGDRCVHRAPGCRRGRPRRSPRGGSRLEQRRGSPACPRRGVPPAPPRRPARRPTRPGPRRAHPCEPASTTSARAGEGQPAELGAADRVERDEVVAGGRRPRGTPRRRRPRAARPRRRPSANAARATPRAPASPLAAALSASAVTAVSHDEDLARRRADVDAVARPCRRRPRCAPGTGKPRARRGSAGRRTCSSLAGRDVEPLAARSGPPSGAPVGVVPAGLHGRRRGRPSRGRLSATTWLSPNRTSPPAMAYFARCGWVYS